MPAERVQKILAQAGFGSRRACEKFIEAGRVKVNGKVISLGAKADPAIDEIFFDQQPIKATSNLRYIELNKPRNVVSTTGAGGAEKRRKVTDLVPRGDDLHLVGRLDRDSEGLILLTNDGELTNLLTHPRYGHEKEYHVLVARSPDAEQLAAWRRGVVLEDGSRTRPADVHVIRRQGQGAWLRVIMKEGKKRQIREVAGLLGMPVVSLLRVRIASLELGTLKAGEWRELTAAEVEALKSGKPKRS